MQLCRQLLTLLLCTLHTLLPPQHLLLLLLLLLLWLLLDGLLGQRQWL
jgi:hypothetical protein